MGRKGLSDFDKEKDEWYYQPKLYIDRKDADTTYIELKNFRLWASQETEEELMDDRMVAEFSKEEPDQKVAKSLKDSPDEKQSQGSMGKMMVTDGTDNFFNGKTQLLIDEIEDINLNLEKRAKIEKESGSSIDYEIKEVKRFLHEIYTWKKGDKSTIEFIRMEFLKQLASLYREKRSNCLSYWKDSAFEKKDRRNLLFEYKSLTWTNDLTFEKRIGGKKKA